MSKVKKSLRYDKSMISKEHQIQFDDFYSEEELDQDDYYQEDYYYEEEEEEKKEQKLTKLLIFPEEPKKVQNFEPPQRNIALEVSVASFIGISNNKLEEIKAEVISFNSCTVCMEEMTNIQMTTVPDCEHSFHRKCLQATIENFVNTNKFPLTCPQY